MTQFALHEPTALEAGAVHRIENGQGHRVTCLTGNLWITQTKDLRDIVLASGESFTLDRRGRTIVFAIGGPALFTLDHPAAASEEASVAEAA
jgi:hypothetical protein